MAHDRHYRWPPVKHYTACNDDRRPTRTRSCSPWASGCARCAARRGLTAQVGLGVALRASPSGISPTSRYGSGNASILVLQQLADALDCSLAELVGDVTTRSPEWLLLRELLRGRSDAELRRARIALADAVRRRRGDRRRAAGGSR